MALVSPRSILGEPAFARQVAGSTAAVLHQDTAHGGVAPPGINHLPSGVMAQSAANFVWQDASGTTLTTPLLANVFYPIAPASIDATSAPIVTVFWHRGASKAP